MAGSRHAGENPIPRHALLAQAGYPGGQVFPELTLHTLESKTLKTLGELIPRGWRRAWAPACAWSTPT